MVEELIFNIFLCTFFQTPFRYNQKRSTADLTSCQTQQKILKRQIQLHYVYTYKYSMFLEIIFIFSSLFIFYPQFLVVDSFFFTIPASTKFWSELGCCQDSACQIRSNPMCKDLMKAHPQLYHQKTYGQIWHCSESCFQWMGLLFYSLRNQ